MDVENLHEYLVERAVRYGITVGKVDLDDEVPGEFDGPTIKLNKDYPLTERAFYLAHSIGSIAEWSVNHDQTQRVFDELRRAKQQRASDKGRLERAVDAYLSFESRTWEFAVSLLADSGHEYFVGAITIFGRADIEAMRLFHLTGQAPVWREFFKDWNEQVRLGARNVAPFKRRVIPMFRAIKIPKQQIVQEEDGG